MQVGWTSDAQIKKGRSEKQGLYVQIKTRRSRVVSSIHTGPVNRLNKKNKTNTVTGYFPNQINGATETM